MTTKPSGFSSSLASFARNLFGAMPTEATSPTSARIRALMARPITAAGPNSRWQPVTSRNASSIESGSISGVKAAKTAKTCSDTSA